MAETAPQDVRPGKTYPYGLIGNCVASALVSTDASVDWMCMPYLDSPSLFARLLDEKKGGSFRIEGVDTVRTSQEYVRFTPILKTRIETRSACRSRSASGRP